MRHKMSGQSRQTRRPANDRAFKKYKLLNQVENNKIKKLVRHCKKYPNDKINAMHLDRINKVGYKCRKKPLVPGSNPTTPKIKIRVMSANYNSSKTAGEQLSKLLGIPLPNLHKKKKKTKVVIKKKKNVQT